MKVPGFRFAGISAGIKGRGIPDLALIVCDRLAAAFGVFTTNRVKAAPVVVSLKNIRNGRARAVIVNSGNANACTGRRGLRDSQAMARVTARALGVPEREVLVCSTGKIGVPLPIDRILSRIPAAVRDLSPGGLLRAARAILTTDRGVKDASLRGQIGGRRFTVVGFAKGAGMIEPHMATMLAFVLTDLNLNGAAGRTIFRRAVDETFNRITVDGDVSTNDTALLLANGLAGNRPFRAASPAGREFSRALKEVMGRLAFQMVADGEGATKVVEVVVRGARSDSEARRIAYTVANSQLVRTSFFGEDPNWGRLLAAAGRSGATLDPDRVDISYDGVRVARGGVSTGRRGEGEAKKAMRKQAFRVILDLHRGRGTFSILTSDLSVAYVRLNADYRT